MNFDAFFATTTPSITEQTLRFRERSGVITINQTLAENLFLEGQYRITDSWLQQDLPVIPATATFIRTTLTAGLLQQWKVALLLTLPESFYTRAEFTWWQQAGRDSLAGVNDAFPQLNLLAGWHFRNRRGDIAVGIMNVTGGDYRFSPINYHTELPRDRSLYTRVRFNF